MITLLNNNFGGAAVTLKDYQSADICVLNGKITVDPTAAAYIAAERLELDLPADFVMKKSAMSSAVLMSNAPIYHYGTVLRCWIENGKLCIEKIAAWDSFGNYDIYIASAFITRGYRGDFQDTQVTGLQILNTDGYFKFDQYKCVVTDHFVYLAAYFRTFPQTETVGYGPFTLQLHGFPTDVNVEIPLVVTNGSYNRTQKGTPLCPGVFENGELTFSFPAGAHNMGGPNSFFNFFAVRDLAE